MTHFDPTADACDIKFELRHCLSTEVDRGKMVYRFVSRRRLYWRRGRVYGASYKVVDVIAGPDGGWDMASIDATACRLYVARSDGVMTINLDTRIVTPRVVAGERVHAVVPIPGKRSRAQHEWQ